MHRAPVMAVGLMALIGFTLNEAPAGADQRVPYTVEVENASARIGERTAVMAKVTPLEGFKIAQSYRSRVIKLSSFDDGVEFPSDMVTGSVENGSAVFEVAVTPTKAGSHPINGVIRVQFHNAGRAEAKSVPLIATVTGTE